MNFDPNKKISYKDGIYGLPFKKQDCKMVYIPVPWDVTTSYKSGTHKGPEAILQASEQIDFFDLDYKDPYLAGLHMLPIPTKIKTLNRTTRVKAEKIIAADEEKMKTSAALKKTLAEVDKASHEVNDWVYKNAKELLKNKQIPVVVGGDHSTPFGAIKAYAEHFEDFGILHVDAHSDTRVAYIGFEHSHASIMYNSMEKFKGVKKLVQVGIRDFCEDEYLYTKNNPKIDVYFDAVLNRRKNSGESFKKIAEEIIGKLPKNIYLSFDIDGLEPRFCPNTGTPVPGGMDYSEFLTLIETLIDSGKKLVGFDLVEVAPSGKKDDEWDANVGMRLLYKLSAHCLYSHGHIKKHSK